jgi:hypothetical protein
MLVLLNDLHKGFGAGIVVDVQIPELGAIGVYTRAQARRNSHVLVNKIDQKSRTRSGERLGNIVSFRDRYRIEKYYLGFEKITAWTIQVELSTPEVVFLVNVQYAPRIAIAF